MKKREWYVEKFKLGPIKIMYVFLAIVKKETAKRGHYHGKKTLSFNLDIYINLKMSKRESTIKI